MTVPTTATAGFDVSKNAFSFPNFASGYESAILTPDLVVRMFGKTAVCLDTQVPCTLSPAANLWINNVNASMDTGRCEGFAVLSGIFFLGLSTPAQFGAGSTRDLTIDGNIPLQQEIAYWYATQNVNVVTQATKSLYAKDAIAFLASYLQPGTTDYYRIGFVRRTAHGVAGGHAVLPTGYEQIAGQPGVYKLHVYDNNYPDSDRAMTLDTNANRWEYQGSTDPTESSADYFGDPGDGNPLYFAPIKVREGTLACPFCTGSTTAQTYASGSASISESDSHGDSAGYGANGAPTTSGQASVQPSFSDVDTWDASSTTTLVLPTGDSKIAVTGTDATVSSQVLKLGAGYAVQASNLSIPSGATDTLTLGGSGASASYASTSGTPVTLSTTLVRSKGGTVQLQVIAPANATTVAVGVNDATGALTAEANGTSGQMVLVSVTKTATDGTTQTGTLVVAGSATSTVTVQSDTWTPGQVLTGSQDTGNGMPVVVGDACTDGKKDGNETDTDCGGSCAATCATGKTCLVSTDCASGGCDATTHVCAASQCTDATRDGSETDVDCGGSCATPCATGLACMVGSDCVTGNCDPATKICALPQCADGVKDGAETGVDCGGGTCAPCAIGTACMVPGDCATDVCTTNVCVDRPKRVFTTSNAYAGDFGGLAAADAICQADATSAKLTGTYAAFLSDQTTSAASRLTHSTGTYVLVDGTEVAANGAAFFSAAHESGISLNENGAMVFADVWTGSDDTGAIDGSPDCTNWTSSTLANTTYTLGETNIKTSPWGNVPQTDAACSASYSFYCIEQ